jgi:hypothetical protein
MEEDALDQTLGGYLEVHTRPPAFSGSDDQPYTVSVEIESVENLAAPFVAFLVFPRWAETGLGIVGHLETPVLWDGKSRDEVQERAHALSLAEVKRLLDDAVLRKSEEVEEGSTPRTERAGRGASRDDAGTSDERGDQP